MSVRHGAGTHDGNVGGDSGLGNGRSCRRDGIFLSGRFLIDRSVFLFNRQLVLFEGFPFFSGSSWGFERLDEILEGLG
jgi:hypothetical protein